MVVAICSFADEKKPLGGEDVERCESGETEEGENKEEDTHTVLETCNVVGDTIEQATAKN